MKESCLLAFWITLRIASSSNSTIQISYEWPDQGSYFTEGKCSFNITEKYASGELTISMSINDDILTTLVMQLLVDYVNSSGNTFVFVNKYEANIGVWEFVFRMKRPVPDTLTGSCTAAIVQDPATTDTTTHVTDTLSSISTETATTTSNEPTTESTLITTSTETVTTTTNKPTTTSTTISTTASAETTTIEPTTETTKITTTDPESTTRVIEATTFTTTPSKSQCMCPCNQVGNAAFVNYTDVEIAEKIDKLVKELTIDKKETSTARRKKISAADNRPSAKAVGSLGVVMLTLTFGLLLLFDLDRIIRFVVKFKKRFNLNKS